MVEVEWQTVQKNGPPRARGNSELSDQYLRRDSYVSGKRCDSTSQSGFKALSEVLIFRRVLSKQGGNAVIPSLSYSGTVFVLSHVSVIAYCLNGSTDKSCKNDKTGENRENDSTDKNCLNDNTKRKGRKMKKTDNSKRDNFSSKIGFIIACIGSAVGMGNVWLFPARLSSLGGASFLIPYIICVILIGYSGVVEEMAFGRAMKAGPMGAFGKTTKLAGKSEKLGEAISLVPVITSLCLAIGYSVVVGWILKYFVGAITGSAIKGLDLEAMGNNFGVTAGNFASVPWHVIGLAITFIIMIFGISKGIEKVNKFMMPAFFVLFVGLAVYISTLAGAENGYKFLFNPDWSYLLRAKTWIYALGQAFFSLSLAGSGTLVYGSYLSEKEDVKFCARNVALFDTLAAIIAGITIIPAMAAAGQELTGGGPGLLFIFLPNVFSQFVGGQAVMIIFFFAMLCAGFSSLVNLFETPVEALQTKFGMSRGKAVGIIAVIGTAVGVCIEGIVSGWMDIFSIYLCPLGAFLAGVMFFWVLGKDFVKEQVSLGAKKPVGDFYYNFGKYVFCGLTILVLVLGTALGGIG